MLKAINTSGGIEQATQNEKRSLETAVDIKSGKAKDKFHLGKIDVLRGIAIILVFFHHSIYVLLPESKMTIYKGLFIDFKEYNIRAIIMNILPISYGWTGVQLFLIISGFLIHLATLKRNLEFQFPNYINRRFWRIYPPYFFALIIFSIFNFGSLSNFISHIFLLHNLSNKYFYGINGSFWSLALEFQFYLIYPLYLVIFKKYGSKTALAFVIGLSIVANFFQIIYHINSIVYETSVLKYWIIWVLGAHLAHAFYHKKRIFNVSGIWLILILISFPLVRFSILYKYFGPYIITLLYVMIMEWFLYSNKIHGKLYNYLFKLISFIGTISYSFYLFHQPFLSKLIALLTIGPGIYFMFLSCFIAFVLICLFSVISFNMLEKPAVKVGQLVFKWCERHKLV